MFSDREGHFAMEMSWPAVFVWEYFWSLHYSSLQCLAKEKLEGIQHSHCLRLHRPLQMIIQYLDLSAHSLKCKYLTFLWKHYVNYQKSVFKTGNGAKREKIFRQSFKFECEGKQRLLAVALCSKLQQAFNCCSPLPTHTPRDGCGHPPREIFLCLLKD